MNKKGAAGLNNLNLYLCLDEIDGKDNYTVTKLEEKVALHGSATCELAFDGSDAVLLGEDGKGFHHMLVLMNDARIAVGFQASAFSKPSPYVCGLRLHAQDLGQADRPARADRREAARYGRRDASSAQPLLPCGYQSLIYRANRS